MNGLSFVWIISKHQIMTTLHLAPLVSVLQEAQFITLVTETGEIPVRACLGDKNGLWSLQSQTRIPTFLRLIGALDNGKVIKKDLILTSATVIENLVQIEDVQLRLYLSTPLNCEQQELAPA
jgi:hypothetical protein